MDNKRYSKLEIAILVAEEEIQKRSYPEKKKKVEKKYYTYRKKKDIYEMKQFIIKVRNKNFRYF